MEMFFLCYINENMYLICNLPFLKMVPPKTNISVLFYIFCFSAEVLFNLLQ